VSGKTQGAIAKRCCEAQIVCFREIAKASTGKALPLLHTHCLKAMSQRGGRYYAIYTGNEVYSTQALQELKIEQLEQEIAVQ
jgi:hypothetical protein